MQLLLYSACMQLNTIQAPQQKIINCYYYYIRIIVMNHVVQQKSTQTTWVYKSCMYTILINFI